MTVPAASAMSGPDRPAILCDFWYAGELAFPVDRFVSTARSANPIIRRLQDAFALLRQSRGYDVVVPNWYTYGPLFIVLSALFARRRICLLEFIDMSANRQSRLVRTLYRVFAAALLAPAMRRTVVAMHVLTDLEAGQIAQRYGIERARIHVIPWPLWGHPGFAADRGEDGNRAPYVFASGRAACDWPLLFAAAERGDWPLVVICSAADRPLVDHLNHAGRARVLSEIPAAEHDRILSDATICAIVLREEHKSSGQVRLGSCISAMIPVVATAVVGLTGYAIDGVTAATVAPGDAAALNAAITGLMRDQTARAALAESARAHCQSFSRSDFFKSVGALLRGL